MPNYCENFLEVMNETVPEDWSITEVLDAIKTDEVILSFDRIIPYPDNFRALDASAQLWEETATKESDWATRPKDGYNQGGYEWCCKTWGTKWDAIEPCIDQQDKYSTVIRFRTAWAPPIPVMDALAQKFPKYKFTLEYYERGMQFCGSIAWENGERKDEAQGEYFGFRGG